MSTPDLSKVSQSSWIRDGIVSALFYSLLTEWLRPLPELANMSDPAAITPFLAAIGIFIALDYLRVPSWAGWPLKFGVCLFLVGYIFSHRQIPSWEWWRHFAEQWIHDAYMAWEGHFLEIGIETRMLLFLFGWALLISVVHSLMVFRQYGLWVIVATLLYLIMLWTFFKADTSEGIVRTVLVGLPLLALLNLPRVERRNLVASRCWGWPLGWVASVVFLTFLVAGGAWYGANAQPREISPADLTTWRNWAERHFDFDKMKNTAGPLVHGDISLSGYDDDDSRLGGKLTLDDRIVFTAWTGRLTYWRGESKSFYDGKGWLADKTESAVTLGELTGMSGEVASRGISSENSLVHSKASGEADDGTIVQMISLTHNAPANMLFVGGHVRQLRQLLAESGQAFTADAVKWNPETGKYSLSGHRAAYYHIEVATGPEPEEKVDTGRYLQLPPGLPHRVAELAASVTAGTDDPFEKAKLLEAFLKTNFAYSLDQPVVPEEGKDFVDHFLFEQKLGYCDHFSTAMVVMLRSVGIPARWVKGFAPGEVTAEGNGGSGIRSDTIGAEAEVAPEGKTLLHVTVRNRDAHSWAEAYIPGRGWIPFEPTPGFGLAASAEAVMAVTGDQAFSGDSRLSLRLRQDGGGFAIVSQWGRQLQTSSNAVIADISSFISRQWPWMAAVLAILALLIAWLWRYRAEIIFRYATLGYTPYTNNRFRLLRTYNRLCRQLFRLFGDKPPHYTIREYVHSLKDVDDSQRAALASFIRLYESMRYDRTGRHGVTKGELADLWYTIAKRPKRGKDSQ